MNSRATLGLGLLLLGALGFTLDRARTRRPVQLRETNVTAHALRGGRELAVGDLDFESLSQSQSELERQLDQLERDLRSDSPRFPELPPGGREGATQSRPPSGGDGGQPGQSALQGGWIFGRHQG